MPGVSRIGVDSAGGVVIGNLAPSVLINGSPAACVDASVAGHGSSPHSAPVMVGSSSTVFAEGIAVCRSGDAASCGHAVSGSSDVSAG